MTDSTRPECVPVLASISAYLDGELPGTECVRIEAHCVGCESCATLVEGLRATLGLCRGVASLPLPAPVRERAQASVQKLLDDALGSPKVRG
ncbi:MAG: zf-HC2 domain-containing protein [Acidobacteriota bacterium]